MINDRYNRFGTGGVGAEVGGFEEILGMVRRIGGARPTAEIFAQFNTLVTEDTAEFTAQLDLSSRVLDCLGEGLGCNESYEPATSLEIVASLESLAEEDLRYRRRLLPSDVDSAKALPNWLTDYHLVVRLNSLSSAATDGPTSLEVVFKPAGAFAWATLSFGLSDPRSLKPVPSDQVPERMANAILRLAIHEIGRSRGPVSGPGQS